MALLAELSNRRFCAALVAMMRADFVIADPDHHEWSADGNIDGRDGCATDEPAAGECRNARCHPLQSFAERARHGSPQRGMLRVLIASMAAVPVIAMGRGGVDVFVVRQPGGNRIAGLGAGSMDHAAGGVARGGENADGGGDDSDNGEDAGGVGAERGGGLGGGSGRGTGGDFRVRGRLGCAGFAGLRPGRWRGRCPVE